MSAPDDLTYTEFKKWYKRTYGAKSTNSSINEAWEKYKEGELGSQGEKSPQKEEESIEAIEPPKQSSKYVTRRYPFYLRYVEEDSVFLLDEVIEKGKERLSPKIQTKLRKALSNLIFTPKKPILLIKLASNPEDDIMKIQLEVQVESNSKIDLEKELSSLVEQSVRNDLLFKGNISIKNGFLGYFPTSQLIEVDRVDEKGQIKSFVYQDNPDEFVDPSVLIEAEFVTNDDKETRIQLSKLTTQQLTDVEYYIFRRLWEEARQYSSQIIVEIHKTKFVISLGYEDEEERIPSTQEILNILDSWNINLDIGNINYKIAVSDITDLKASETEEEEPEEEESEQQPSEEEEEEPSEEERVEEEEVSEETSSIDRRTPSPRKRSPENDNDIVDFVYTYKITEKEERVKQLSNKEANQLQNSISDKLEDIEDGTLRDVEYDDISSTILITVETVRSNRLLVGQQLNEKLKDDNIIKVGKRQFVIVIPRRSPSLSPKKPKTKLEKVLDKGTKEIEEQRKTKQKPKTKLDVVLEEGKTKIRKELPVIVSPSKSRKAKHIYNFKVENPKKGDTYSFVFITVEEIDGEFIEYTKILREEDHKKFDKIFTQAWNNLPKDVQSMNVIEYIDNVYEIELVATNSKEETILRALRNLLSHPITTKDKKILSLIIARLSGRTPPGKYSTIQEEESEEGVEETTKKTMYRGGKDDVFQTLTDKERNVVLRKSKQKSRYSKYYSTDNFDLEDEDDIPDPLFEYNYNYILEEIDHPLPIPFRKKLTKKDRTKLEKVYFDELNRKFQKKDYVDVKIIELAPAFYEISVRGNENTSYYDVKQIINSVLERTIKIVDIDVNFSTAQFRQDPKLETYYYSYTLSQPMNNKKDIVNILDIITDSGRVVDRFEYPQTGLITGIKYIDDENIDIYVETTQEKEEGLSDRLDEYLSYINQQEDLLPYNIITREEKEEEEEEEEEKEVKKSETKKRLKEVTFEYQLAAKGKKATGGNITGDEEDKVTHIVTQFETDNAFVSEVKVNEDGTVYITLKPNKGVTEESLKEELDEYLSDKKVKSKKRTLSFVSL